MKKSKVKITEFDCTGIKLNEFEIIPSSITVTNMNQLLLKLTGIKTLFLAFIMRCFYIKAEIKTKQFLGSQDKFYWFYQTGRYAIFKNKFYSDHSVERSHDISGWMGIKDFKKSVVRYIK